MKLIKIPFNLGGLGKTEGVEEAPDKIIENIKEFYLNEDQVLPVFDIEEVSVNKGSIEETNQNIYEKAKAVLGETDKVIFLGGDHAITYSLVKGFASGTNPGMIIFDAHPDCQSDFKPPTHEDLLIALVKERVIKPQNIILVGTRNWHKDELKFLQENKIRFFSMKQITNFGKEDVSETIMETARGFSELYVSIDIDVLDPAFAPGTGYREPGGLSTRDLLFFLHRLKKLKNLRAIDIVEVNPSKDMDDITSKVAGKLVVEMC